MNSLTVSQSFLAKSFIPLTIPSIKLYAILNPFSDGECISRKSHTALYIVLPISHAAFHSIFTPALSPLIIPKTKSLAILSESLRLLNQVFIPSSAFSRYGRIISNALANKLCSLIQSLNATIASPTEAVILRISTSAIPRTLQIPLKA